MGGPSRSYSSIINKLFKKYQKEGMAIMPYTIEDYQREVKSAHCRALRFFRQTDSSALIPPRPKLYPF